MKEKRSPVEEPGEKEENWWEVYPLCGSKLANRRCRLVCSNPECHYFQSCSEFDA